MSHIASIGFDAPSEEEFRAMVQEFLKGKKGEPFFTDSDQSYLAIPDESGAQIWLQISEKKEILGFRPHFHGNAKMKVTVTSSQSAEGSLSGFWLGFCNPQGDRHEASGGLYTFLFDCPDFQVFVPPLLPWHSTLQLAGFAERIEFISDNQEEQLAFSPLMRQTEEGDKEPTAMVRLKGKILSGSTLTNVLTGQQYCHALIATLGGEIDLVWPSTLGEEVPSAGTLVKAQAWLSGRFSERPRLRGRGLRGLLFGRR